MNDDFTFEPLPLVEGVSVPDWATDVGLTLRDYFAIKALAGLLPTVLTYSAELERQSSPVDLEVFMAAMAYHYADAMLKARQA